jgi:hypothetical protein
VSATKIVSQLTILKVSKTNRLFGKFSWFSPYQYHAAVFHGFKHNAPEGTR